MQKKLVHWKPVRIGNDGRKFLHDGIIERSMLLYHTLEWRWVEKIYCTHRIRFSPVKSWSNPTNPFRDCREKESCDMLFGRETPLQGVTAYGMCWSINQDERWWLDPCNRTKNCRVRLQANLETIRHIGCELISKKNGALFGGVVRYHEEKKLDNIQDSVKSGAFKEVSRTAAGVMMYKSPTSSWQQEIRLLWFDRELEEEGFYITVNPLKMIDEIVVSPYEPVEVRKTVQDEIEKLMAGTSPK